MSKVLWSTLALLITTGAFAQGDNPPEQQGQPAMHKVDFSYAFATPHRLTVARPDSGDKTLLDAEPGALRVSWSYQSLMDFPFIAFVTPPANWAVKLQPKVDGHPFAKSTWARTEGILPVLSNVYEDPQGRMELEVTGGMNATIVRVSMENTSEQPLQFSLQCDSQRGFFGYNPGYVDSESPKDHLLAGWGDRADRVIVFSVGADEYTVAGPTTLLPVWKVEPKQTRVGWLIRPYRLYSADLNASRLQNWEEEASAAKAEWRTLIGRAARLIVPDAKVEEAFKACFGDLFIMREPIPGRRLASMPGTDGYRAGSCGETAIMAIAIDQLGLHKEAARGYDPCFESQGEDGNWADPTGWGHLMWLAAGFKSWAAIEHYKLSGDRNYIEQLYPRMLASSRFNERMRARTRVLKDGVRPLTYGLMPRGMGDCGLKDGDDLYGVFLPHNIWSVYADGVTLEVAHILGKADNIGELERIHDTALKDLLEALDKGAIQENGYRWIPGVAGKTCGSRWGALNALMPCHILPPEHELVAGTIQHLRSQMSAGGLPLNTGWLPAGLWVAIALDNLAEAHLERNEGDEAVELFYATLNHGTPLYTWCEERAPQPGAAETTGDRQHLWTPVAVVRALRDMLVMEQDGGLHLARGTDRAWLASGQPIGIENVCTWFGTVSYTMTFDAASGTLRGTVTFPDSAETPAGWAVLHVRLPGTLRVKSVDAASAAAVLPDGTGLRWETPRGTLHFEAKVE